MALSDQQQLQAADINQDLWEGKLLSITEDDMNDILNGNNNNLLFHTMVNIDLIYIKYRLTI